MPYTVLIRCPVTHNWAAGGAARSPAPLRAVEIDQVHQLGCPMSVKDPACIEVAIELKSGSQILETEVVKAIGGGVFARCLHAPVSVAYDPADDDLERVVSVRSRER